jgi:hypothetical protein
MDPQASAETNPRCDEEAELLLARYAALLATEDEHLRQFRMRDLDRLTQEKIELEANMARFVDRLRANPGIISERTREHWREQAPFIRKQNERNLLRLEHSISLVSGLTNKLTGQTPLTYTARRSLAYTSASRPVLTNSVG